MKSGILREDEGFDLVVDGKDRTFSEDEPGAFEMARELKKRNRRSLIQIRTRATGALREMLEDGRVA